MTEIASHELNVIARWWSAKHKGGCLMARNSQHASYEVFEVCTVDVCGKHHQGARAVCGWCQTANSISVNTFGHGSGHGGDEIREQFARKKFEGMGWKVGKTAKENRCPACFSKIKLAAKSKHEAAMNKDSKVIPLKQDALSGASQVAIAAAIEPLHASTREDRRIILAKLQEVYVDERVGYKAGWNDKRIATDLGVQPLWVAQLRDEHFGPEIDERHSKLLASAEALLTEMRETAATMEKMITKSMQLEAIWRELKGEKA